VFPVLMYARQMHGRCLPPILGLMTLALVLASACSSTPLVSDGGRKGPFDEPFDGPHAQSDGGVDAPPLPLDAGDCHCLLGSDHILRMSWACLCANYGDLCSSDEGQFCDSNVGWTKGCGLDVYSGYTIGGIDEWVFDHQSGAVVGIQFVSEDSVFTCPTDPNQQSSEVAAGTFPDPTCVGAAACGCTDAGPPCPQPDSGLIEHP
jgi:hypothetical protein